MTPARFRWGMLFVLVGTLLLLVNADVLNYNFWVDFVYLIPFLLIAIGIEKIFSQTRFKFISYLTTVALVGGAIYVAFAGSSITESGNFFKSSNLVYNEDQDKVDLIEADLTLGESSLTIRDAGDELMNARFGELSRKPQSSLNIEGRTARILLDNQSSPRFWRGSIKIDSDEPQDWRLSFSRQVPLNLTLNSDNNELHLNLATTPLKSLNVKADDADIYIKVGDLESIVNLNISGKDSQLRLRVPQDAGLAVTGVNDQAYLEQIGLVARGNEFVSPTFDTTQVRIKVELDEQFRSLSIDYY